MKTYEKSKLMSRAWAICRATGANFSTCLKKAWELNSLSVRLHKAGAVKLAYRKKDGTIRYALATLFDTERYVNGNGNRSENPKVFTYFDLEKGEFRCFKVENLISWI